VNGSTDFWKTFPLSRRPKSLPFTPPEEKMCGGLDLPASIVLLRC